MPTARGTLAAVLALLRGHAVDLSAEQDSIVSELSAVFLQGFRDGAPDVPIDSAVTSLCADWALNRAGELIRDISQTTREGIAELTAAAVQDGLHPDQLAAALRDYSGFGPARAETIARTETAIAVSQGQRAAAVIVGHDEKRWIGGGPHECDICLGNDDDGWIAIDDLFGSGDDTVPAHPRCTCSVSYRTRNAYTEDKATRPAIVAEARCPQCGRWVGRNVNVGAEVYCPQHKAVTIRA